MLVVCFQQSVYRLQYAFLLERCHWRTATCLHHHLDAVFFRLHPKSDLPTHGHDSNRGHVLAGHSLGEGEKTLHPNDDVNKSQSSNDTFPTGMHIAAYKLIVENTLPALHQLKKTLSQKSKEFENVIKIGRTHMMDATPG